MIASRPRIQMVLAAIALVPLATAIFVRPAPEPPKDETPRVARPAIEELPLAMYALDAVIVDGRLVSPSTQPIAVRHGASVTVIGWALDSHTMGRAEALAVSIDGGAPGTLHGYGILRPDVAKALGIAEAGQGGFRSILPSQHLSIGQHRVQLCLLLSPGHRAVIPSLISLSVVR